MRRGAAVSWGFGRKRWLSRASALRPTAPFHTVSRRLVSDLCQIRRVRSRATSLIRESGDPSARRRCSSGPGGAGSHPGPSAAPSRGPLRSRSSVGCDSSSPAAAQHVPLDAVRELFATDLSEDLALVSGDSSPDDVDVLQDPSRSATPAPSKRLAVARPEVTRSASV